MKSAVVGLLLASSAALLGGCAVYPDGSAYGGGYPGVYDDPGYGYYGGPPVVQPGVVIGGGYYSGPAYYGPGRSRYWDDGPGWRRPPPGGWHGGQSRDRGPGGQPQAGGGHPNGPPPQAGGGRPPAAQPPQANGGAPMPKAVGGRPPGPNRAPPSSDGGGRESGNSRGFIGRYGG
ncbi:hypothetical protein NOV72_05692 [Caballeronia novacaledonica]|uniref:Lipoprotein n=1 Tax=Caballeronia novacaledonica TaxID=1544861 RepID=A0A2U3IE68_9BURK|nr:hypothetical protein [Caballeronia novacaledonica]SPB18494.1 hypothetical protein NOV72_05692 [Caballeronia novacaledonica]